MNNYRSMIGVVARKALNELGYPIKGTDEKEAAVLGIIVEIARKVDALEKAEERRRSGDCPIIQVSDSSVCKDCGLTWDVNDPFPPDCPRPRLPKPPPPPPPRTFKF